MMPWDALGCSGMLWDAKSAVIWRLLGGRGGESGGCPIDGSTVGAMGLNLPIFVWRVQEVAGGGRR